MAKQLNIRSDEAYRLAHEMADREKLPVTEVVLRALRRQAERQELRRDLTPDQQAVYDAILAISDEAAATKFPGATSYHDDLYDENGLPI